MDKAAISDLDVIHVACCFDRNMLVPALILAESLRRTHVGPRKIELHAFDIDDCLSELDLSSLNDDRFRITQRRPDFQGLGLIDTSSSFIASQATYCRLLIGDHLTHVSRVIYFDADVIVVKDVSPLYDVPLNGKTLGVCRDLEMIYLAHEKAQASILSSLQLPAEDYFNAGMLVIDLDRWRADDLFNRLWTLALDPPFPFLFSDQDPLNFLMRDEKEFIDQRWNVLAGAELLNPNNSRVSDESKHQRELALRDPWVIHFAGNVKPWRFSDRATTFQWYYWRVALQSPLAMLAVRYAIAENKICAIDVDPAQSIPPSLARSASLGAS